MSLKPIAGTAKKRKFLAFDLEWVPPDDITRPVLEEKWNGPRYSKPMELRLVGVFDGEEYRFYKSIREFLDEEMVPKNKGCWFYAHFGGLADMEFVFDEIIRIAAEDGGYAYRIRSCFSGSAAIITKVMRGKQTWTFVDSFWLIREKLSKIGKELGMMKLEEEKRRTKKEAREYFRSTSLPKLMDYNEQDNRILHAAVEKFEDVLMSIGGQLQMTIASTGMMLFRRRFLKRVIKTSEPFNEIIEQAYFASRVEVFNKAAENFLIYDINSSFPFAMTFPCPGNFRERRSTIPKGEGSIYFAEVDIEVPADLYLPPVPIRVGGRLFFPTGTWKTWLSGIDIDLAEKVGCKILRVHDVIQYDACDDLRDYALTIYEMRKAAKSSYEKLVFKYLLNCLYGKFAEGTIKTTIFVHPDKIDRDGMRMLMPGVWQLEKETQISHRHVPMSAWITAIARRTLYEHLDAAYKQTGIVHYCDTDSVATPAKLVSDPNELGALKLEKRMTWAKFVAPKVYQGEGEELQRDGSWKNVFLNRAKGFSLPDDKKEAVSELTEIIEGKEIYVQRMARIREICWGVASGALSDSRPVEVLIRKALTGKNITKRKQLDDGGTRPWRVSEILKLVKKEGQI